MGTLLIDTDGIDRRKLIAARKRAGITASEMARRLGISRARYHHYENGHRRMPGGILVLLASVLDCSLHDLTVSAERPA